MIAENRVGVRVLLGKEMISAQAVQYLAAACSACQLPRYRCRHVGEECGFQQKPAGFAVRLLKDFRCKEIEKLLWRIDGDVLSRRMFSALRHQHQTCNPSLCPFVYVTNRLIRKVVEPFQANHFPGLVQIKGNIGRCHGAQFSADPKAGERWRGILTADNEDGDSFGEDIQPVAYNFMEL